MAYLLSLAIGIIAGLRAMTVPAALGRDQFAAFSEDAVAIGDAFLILAVPS